MEKINERIKKKKIQIEKTEERLIKYKDQLKSYEKQKQEIKIKDLLSVLDDKGLDIAEATSLLASKKINNEEENNNNNQNNNGFQ